MSKTCHCLCFGKHRQHLYNKNCTQMKGRKTLMTQVYQCPVFKESTFEFTFNRCKKEKKTVDPHYCLFISSWISQTSSNIHMFPNSLFFGVCAKNLRFLRLTTVVFSSLILRQRSSGALLEAWIQRGLLVPQIPRENSCSSWNGSCVAQLTAHPTTSVQLF